MTPRKRPRTTTSPQSKGNLPAEPGPKDVVHNTSQDRKTPAPTYPIPDSDPPYTLMPGGRGTTPVKTRPKPTTGQHRPGPMTSHPTARPPRERPLATHDATTTWLAGPPIPGLGPYQGRATMHRYGSHRAN